MAALAGWSVIALSGPAAASAGLMPAQWSWSVGIAAFERSQDIVGDVERRRCASVVPTSTIKLAPRRCITC